MKFLVEYHLLAAQGRQLPSTRRRVVEAGHMTEALVKFVEDVRPGQDCDEVRVVEIDEEG